MQEMTPYKRARIVKSQQKDGENNRDYISTMPDDIISNILSRLPAKHAVGTCVLSKAWEYKWASIYDINIYDGDFYNRKLFEAYSEKHDSMFVNFVDRVLLHSRNMRRFSFASMTEYEKGHFERWLSIVFGRNVQNVSIFSRADVMLPVSLSSCTSLRTLGIEIMCCSWKAPVKNYFPNLTKLYLFALDIVNENCGTDTLVFDFPVLETFEMSVKWSNVKFVEIYAPSLISFKTDTWGRSECSYLIKIIGAGIQKFETHGDCLEDFNLTAPTISSATMINTGRLHWCEEVVKCGQQIRMLLNEFSSLKTLELSCYLTLGLGHTKPGFPLSCFSKLEKLALSSPEYLWPPLSNFQELFEGLLELLHSAPLLKYLDLAICGFFNEDFEYGALDSVPSCVVSHLEEIKFDRFTGETPAFPLAMFLMEHGAHLKKLSFHTNGEKKDEVAEQLTKFPKASTCLTTVVT